MKRGSSVDRVGGTPPSRNSREDYNTGRVPFALPDENSPCGAGDGWIDRGDGGDQDKVKQEGCDTTCGGRNFKANTGNDNP